MTIERCNAEIERINAEVARGGLNDGDRWGATIGEADWEAEKRIMSELPKPYYDDGKGIVIYHADAREIAPCLKCDVIIADPPYGVGKKYGHTVDSLEAFQDAVRLIVGTGLPAALFVPVCRVFDLPVRPQWMAIWSKLYGASGLIAYPIYPHWEGIACYSISGDFAGNKGHRSDVFSFAPAVANGSGHPTPKPVDLMRELIAWMPNGVIGDFYMGSGTTLVAAKQIGRSCIGVEIEEKFCELAVKRLRQAVFEFREPEPQQTPGNLFEANA